MSNTTAKDVFQDEQLRFRDILTVKIKIVISKMSILGIRVGLSIQFVQEKGFLYLRFMSCIIGKDTTFILRGKKGM